MDAKVIPPWKEAVSAFSKQASETEIYHSFGKSRKQRVPTKQPSRICMKATAASPSLVVIQDDEPDFGPRSKPSSTRP
jgi:hypothetical protein